MGHGGAQRGSSVAVAGVSHVGMVALAAMVEGSGTPCGSTPPCMHACMRPAGWAQMCSSMHMAAPVRQMRTAAMPPLNALEGLKQPPKQSWSCHGRRQAGSHTPQAGRQAGPLLAYWLHPTRTMMAGRPACHGLMVSRRFCDDVEGPFVKHPLVIVLAMHWRQWTLPEQGPSGKGKNACLPRLQQYGP